MYVTLAPLYVQRDGLNEAEALCRKAIALDAERAPKPTGTWRGFTTPGVPATRRCLPCKLALPEGRSFPATAYYQQLQADVCFELGRAFEAKRMKSQAIEAYSRSLQLDPEPRRRRAAGSRSWAQRAAFASSSSNVWSAGTCSSTCFFELGHSISTREAWSRTPARRTAGRRWCSGSCRTD